MKDIIEPAETEALKKEDTYSSNEFDRHFEYLASLLKKLYNRDQKEEENGYPCAVDFFRYNFKSEHKTRMLAVVNTIGFEKIRDAFNVLNQECDSLIQEKENLFGIFKWHQFRKSIPESESQTIKQIGRYIHLTLIRLNIIKQKKLKQLPENILQCKKQALSVIRPLLNEIFSIAEDLLNENKKKS